MNLCIGIWWITLLGGIVAAAAAATTPATDSNASKSTITRPRSSKSENTADNEVEDYSRNAVTHRIPTSLDTLTSFHSAPPTNQPPKRKEAPSTTSKSLKTKAKYDCPKPEKWQFQLFPIVCSKNLDCKSSSEEPMLCCLQFGIKRCVHGVAMQPEEPKHDRLFGLISRKCPKQPLAELFWNVQTCEDDRDCWPRVCCPDGAKKYCRTSTPELRQLPRQLSYPYEAVSSYLECTPPPPAVFDLYPKKCTNTLDCFPNVCCQEAGEKHCRPPKKSLLALVAGVAQNVNLSLFNRAFSRATK